MELIYIVVLITIGGSLAIAATIFCILKYKKQNMNDAALIGYIMSGVFAFIGLYFMFAAYCNKLHNSRHTYSFIENIEEYEITEKTSINPSGDTIYLYDIKYFKKLP